MALVYDPEFFGSLTKASWLEAPEVTKISGLQPEDPRYRLALLRICEDIRSHRRDLLPRVSHDRVRVMDDREAEEHTHSEMRRGLRTFARNTRRRGAIDRSGFSADERRAAEVVDMAGAAIALHSRKALRDAETKAKALLAGGEEKRIA